MNISRGTFPLKTSPCAISVSGLSKTFRTSWGRRVEALRDVSFEVSEGEIYGLLGPNGAGKSTTLKILLGLMKPTCGEGTLLGHPLGSLEARQRIGFLPENPYFFEYLTAQEFLETCAWLSGVSREGRKQRIQTLLERVGLDPGSRLRLRKFSKGMLQRVGLAQALIHEPELIILDEPMSGLDPIGRREVRDLILEQKKKGKTVIFSSHILPDVESLCERVGILVEGELRRSGRVSDLVRHDKSGFEIEAGKLPQSLRTSWTTEGIARNAGDRTIIPVPDQKELSERIAQIQNAGGLLLAVKPLRGSLEAVFLAEVDEKKRPAVLPMKASNGGETA